MIKVPYFKIETFGSLDGPGIRLMVFLEGCTYRCIYCHNPEAWAATSGKTISANEIIDLYQNNKEFYKNGGITISGGEPLLHLDFLIELSKLTKKNGIHLTIDTSATNFSTQNINKYKQLFANVDLWIIDIKAIDEPMHLTLTSVSQLKEIEFIKLLEQNKKPYWIRHVIVEGYNDTKQSVEKIAKFIKQLKYIKKFELLPFHNMAQSHYEKLNLDYKLKDHRETSKERIEELIDVVRNSLNEK